MDLEIPKLPKEYVSVFRVDAKNARYVNNDNTYFDGYQDTPEKGGKIYYHIYRSYDEAKNDILFILEKDKSFIFVIFDNDGNELEFIRPERNITPAIEAKRNIFVQLWRKISH